MKYYKKVPKLIIKQILKINAKIMIQKLKKSDNPYLKKITNIISETLNNNLTTEEKDFVNRIELKRHELINNPTLISITDFGAGNGREIRDDNEMNAGKVLSTSVGQVCKDDSKPYFWSLLLFKVIREFKPSIGLELGTSLGISASYQASAQKLNGQGKFLTMEGATSLASIAENNFKELFLDNIELIQGRFQDNLEKVLNDNNPIDYVFIDGHHEEKATISYFEMIKPYLSKEAIVIFDDIHWSAGMKRAWKKIVEDKKIKLSIDLRSIGLCVLDENIREKEHYKIPLI